MSKKWLFILIAILAVVSGCGQTTGSGEDTIKLGITQYVEHPSLDAAREGFIEALADHGYVEGENLTIDLQNAQTNSGTNATIAQQFASGDYDLILAIATPSAQAVVTQVRDTGKDTPIFFTAITDPVAAGLIESFEEPGSNVTGTSDTHPDAVSNVLKAAKEMFPQAEKVGIIYDAGEDNSVENVAQAKEVLNELGLEAVEKTATDPNGVSTAANSLIGEADVIYIPLDNLVVSNLESVGMVAQENGIPIFVGEGDSVERAGGGFVGYGFKYFDLGYQTGEMAVKVIKDGVNPADIPAERPSTLGLYVNYKNAEAQGISNSKDLIRNLPEELRQNLVEFE
ncbi:ABC transporter substrate-binding protein [Bacillus horti]|uniref:ABC transport system substrate-binding protein n=1 Tax=Caldalkalibacillus horti TaxID=77523 RepID=A0ABT9W238_9BACI|nr:ABC transporter substrate-binding protein [Bacillus horti]MDQ0167318.1 putative ABC transport system substrate-binding protein [Bacillus horti]